MSRRPLTPDDILAAVSGLTGWQLSEDQSSLRQTFKFSDFSTAFAFMTRIAMAAEKHDHHPEWSNIYNRVEITLTTHSAKGLSELDMQMAKLINDYAIESDRAASLVK